MNSFGVAYIQQIKIRCYIMGQGDAPCFILLLKFASVMNSFRVAYIQRIKMRCYNIDQGRASDLSG